MISSPPDFADLINRFESLGRKDRQAVLALLSNEEREAVQQAIAEKHRQAEDEQRRLRASDRQFLGYSHELAVLAENAVKGLPTGMTEMARRALVAEHDAIVASIEQAPQTFAHTMSVWFDRLFGSEERRKS